MAKHDMKPPESFEAPDASLPNMMIIGKSQPGKSSLTVLVMTSMLDGYQGSGPIPPPKQAPEPPDLP